MLKYMNQYEPDSQELNQFEDWWKQQQDQAIERIQKEIIEAQINRQ